MRLPGNPLPDVQAELNKFDARLKAIEDASVAELPAIRSLLERLLEIEEGRDG